MSPTFRSLSGPGQPPGSESSSLDAWYTRVQDVPLEKLSDGDLARASRQALFLEHIVPIALARLHEDPSAGELFDGELASVIARLPKSFWSAHLDLLSRTMTVLGKAEPRVDEDVREEVHAFLAEGERVLGK
jgi:hypothetical protein